MTRRDRCGVFRRRYCELGWRCPALGRSGPALGAPEAAWPVFRIIATRPSGAQPRGIGPPARVRVGSGLLGPERPRRVTDRSATGVGGRQGRSDWQRPSLNAGPGQTAGWQEHVEPFVMGHCKAGSLSLFACASSGSSEAARWRTGLHSAPTSLPVGSDTPPESPVVRNPG
jgi:hypothetical protein